ncbi:MAG: hypothetical protein Q9167_006625 [Letrouitia subvulpina]
MARVQSFLEAMDQYRKVVEAFLNCTPFLGYVWVADTWVKSFDAILDAYKKIEERLPTFMKYSALFETNPELRRALEFYYCDILEFHAHAMKFLNRPGWKKLFDSSWKTFDTHFRRILDSLDRHKDLIESEKGTLAVLEAQKAREITEAYSKEMAEREAREKIKVLIERLNPTDYKRDQFDASEQRRQRRSGEWLYKNSYFCRWYDLDAVCNPLLYIHGVPGAGKTVLSSIVIERLLEDRHEPVLYFYCKHNQPGKNRYNDILSGLVAQLVQHDNALADCLYDICSSKDQLDVLGVLEKLAETAFESQAGCYVVVDGLDECQPKEAERIISWLLLHNKAIQPADSGHVRLLFVGQRTEILLRMLAPAVAISLDGPEHRADIQEYVEGAASKVKDQFGIDPRIEAQIVVRVTGAATSMFLFAKLVMENLLNQVTQKDVIRELEPSVFPVDLHGAYLISKGLISMPLQHLEMANFCLDYLLSAPLGLSASEEEVEQRTKDGYFAFHDYASVHLFDHLFYVVENCVEGDDTVQKDLSFRCQSFIERYEISEQCLSSYQKHNPIHIAQFIRSISENARERNKSYDIEWRTLRIRRILEGYVERLQPTNEAYDVALDMYGVRVFKCRKVDCQFYFKGFATRSERDSHMDRHDRPYMCDQRGCPFQSLGFESKDQLEKHTKNNHVIIDDTVCTFPKLHNIRGDTIFKAIARDDFTAIKDILDQGAAVDQTSRPQSGDTPLILAARNSQSNVCKLLLERGADVNFYRPSGMYITAIHAAVTSGNIETLQCLLASKDVNPDQPDWSGNTPLLIAAEKGPSAMVKLLIDSKRVNVDKFNARCHCALSLSIWSDDLFDLLINYTHEETIRKILDYNISPRLIKSLLRTDKGGVWLKEFDERGRGLIHTAIDIGDYKSAKLLIQLGKFKLNSMAAGKCGLDLTPLGRLMELSWKERDQPDREDTIKMLIALEKVNPDTVTEQDGTSLARVVQRGDLSTVTMLLATGKVDINAIDFEGRTPFSRAVEFGNKEIIEAFLATGKVNIDKRGHNWETMLSSALASHRVDEAKWLLRYKDANLNGGTINEETWDIYDAAKRLHKAGAIDYVDFQRFDTAFWYHQFYLDPICTGTAIQQPLE